jgi:uncharacterized membrane protein
MQTKDAATLRIMRGVTVNREIEDVYNYWRDFENFPAFMQHLESVTVHGFRSHWVAKGPAGSKAEWDAEIVAIRPNELIAWRTSPQGMIDSEGSVEFRQAPGDRGTEVRLTMSYEPPAGTSIAELLDTDPDRQIRDDLRRFKQVLETGEVLRSDGAPQGTDVKKSRQRVAQPMAAEARR